VSKLEPYHEDPDNPNFTPEPPELVEEEPKWEVEAILDSKLSYCSWLNGKAGRTPKILGSQKTTSFTPRTLSMLSTKSIQEPLDIFPPENSQESPQPRSRERSNANKKFEQCPSNHWIFSSASGQGHGRTSRLHGFARFRTRQVQTFAISLVSLV